ncbi:hypothetical protein [Burkholderia sp. 22PA0106]|uniref:hypothetical protein n=1 Tax=Burkholderia sp. 22PA0106 TaxID=3237371 RepID=UPI0039C0658D
MLTTAIAAAHERGDRMLRASNQWGGPAQKERKSRYLFRGDGVAGEDDSRGIIVPEHPALAVVVRSPGRTRCPHPATDAGSYVLRYHCVLRFLPMQPSYESTSLRPK